MTHIAETSGHFTSEMVGVLWTQGRTIGAFERNGVASSVADDTMDRKKLERITRQLRSLRRSQPKAKELQSLAVQLGRKSVNRGKEPMYESEAFSHLWPLSIPNHKGRDLPTGTKNSILNQLEEDLDAWEEALSRSERGNGGGSGNESER